MTTIASGRAAELYASTILGRPVADEGFGRCVSVEMRTATVAEQSLVSGGLRVGDFVVFKFDRD